MTRFSKVLAAFGLALVFGMFEAPAVRAQGAVGFQPVITPFPDGVSLGVTPVVTADRRYVRLGLNPAFNTIRGVDVFSFGAGAVAGGGVGGGFGGGFGNIGPGQFGATRGAAMFNSKVALPTVSQRGIVSVAPGGYVARFGNPYGGNPYGPLGFGYGPSFGALPYGGYGGLGFGGPVPFGTSGFAVGRPYGSFGNGFNRFNRYPYGYVPPAATINTLGPLNNSIRSAIAPGSWRY